jgi:DNA-binding transcriptional MerR regulator
LLKTINALLGHHQIAGANQIKMGTAKEKQSFSAGEAARIAGVPYGTLDYWARTKFITPSLAEADGVGSDRRYDFKDLVALRVAKELRQAGVSTQALRRVIECLRTLKNRNTKTLLAESHLVVTGSDVHLAVGPEHLVSVLTNPGQSVFAFTVDIGRTIRILERDVEALRAA